MYVFSVLLNGHIIYLANSNDMVSVLMEQFGGKWQNCHCVRLTSNCQFHSSIWKWIRHFHWHFNHNVWKTLLFLWMCRRHFHLQKGPT